MNKVRIFEKKPTPKNPEILVVAMCLSYGDYSAMMRSFRSKNISKYYFAERDMTLAEIEYESARWRLHWHKYATWEGLIRDEYRVTEDMEWANRLLALSRLEKSLPELLENLEND